MACRGRAGREERAWVRYLPPPATVMKLDMSVRRFLSQSVDVVSMFISRAGYSNTTYVRTMSIHGTFR